MKKLLMILPLAMILCFMVGCQDKEAMAELEAMKAQAEVEEQNKDLVRRWVEEEDKGNFDIYEELLAPDYVCYYPGSPEPLNREAHKQSAILFFKSFPDTIHTIENMIAENDLVAFHTTLKGTHKGEFMGITPTDNEINVGAVWICRIKEGKIIEVRGVGDLLGMMMQLGMELKPKEAEK